LRASLATWYGAMSSATSSADPATLAVTSLATLRQISSYLNTIAVLVNGAVPGATVNAATLTGYKTNVSTARTEVNGSITELTASQTAFLNARNQLALAQAGATPQDVEAQRALLLQAQAAAANAEVTLHHAQLIAPFAGTVEKLTAKIGQVVAPGAPMLSLINN